MSDCYEVKNDVLEAMRQIAIANYDAEDRCRQIAEVIEAIQTGDNITFEPLDE